MSVEQHDTRVRTIHRPTAEQVAVIRHELPMMTVLSTASEVESVFAPSAQRSASNRIVFAEIGNAGTYATK